MSSRGDILIVDDEPNAITVLSAILTEEGYKVMESENVERAMEIVSCGPVDAVITDLKMPGKDGMYFFDHLSKRYPDIPVIFLTAYGTIESAVSAMMGGAFYYCMKPPDYPTLKVILAKAVAQRGLRGGQTTRRENPAAGAPYHIIGSSSEVKRLLETIEAVKVSPSNVLICGETGTGKELIARALHDPGETSKGPFVAVNCAAIPKELIEAELFGCEKGAFTGAVSRRIGKFEEAANGVIFLDEIGDLELSMQAKLLRVLQEREIERIGSNRKIKVGFRLVSATNSDLLEGVKNGSFREDLYYRVNVIEIKVPPLRERKDDIPVLASAFLDEFCARERKQVALADEVLEAFPQYQWPGNVRQLRNVIERAVVLNTSGIITLEALPPEFRLFGENHAHAKSGKTLRELELVAIKDALKTCDGNKSKAARMLNISRKAFYKRLSDEENSRLTSSRVL
jgi:two-component system response regulator HydG